MRAEGVLDERTRMVNVVVRVERPYDSVPPLAMGLFVTIEIRGVEVPDAVWLPRSAVHESETVYIVDGESRIRFRPVEIIRYDRDSVLVTGIEKEELVAVSPIKIVTDGIKVNYQIEGRDGGEETGRMGPAPDSESSAPERDPKESPRAGPE